MLRDAIPDVHGHAKGEHPAYERERPVAYTARMLVLWFWHAARRGYPRDLTVTDHTNYLTPGDPAAVQTARRALALARDGEIAAAAELAGVSPGQIETLAGAFAAGMRCSIGVEADDDPRNDPNAAAILAELAPDFVIRSVHFLPVSHPETGAPWLWPFDNPEFSFVYDRVGTEATWELYIEKLLGEIEREPCNAIGHFYVPAKFGNWPAPAKLDAYEDRFVEACRLRGVAVELNTRLLYREPSLQARDAYLAANRRLLHKAKAAGLRVVVGSDAHAPDDQGRGFEYAVDLLRESGIEPAP